MSRSDTRFSVYPASKAVEIVGATAPQLNEAIECWAAQLTRSIADNSKTFVKASEEFTGVRLEVQPLHEWAMLAEAIGDLSIDPDFPNPGALLATAVDDSNRLRDLGSKWYHDESEDDTKVYVRRRDESIRRLVGKVQQLDYAHAWALLLTIRWARAHEGVCLDKDDWWMLTFRRQWQERQAGQNAAKKRPSGRKSQDKHVS